METTPTNRNERNARGNDFESEKELADLAEKVFGEVMEDMLGIEVRLTEKNGPEDAGTSDIEGPMAVDAVGAAAGRRHIFAAQVTISSMLAKMKKMAEHTEAMPFVPTRRIIDHDQYPDEPSSVPRLNFRVENGLMRRYMDNPEAVRPEIAKLFRAQILLNVAMHEEKMTKMKKTLKGGSVKMVPLPASQLARVKESESYRQLQELRALCAIK